MRALSLGGTRIGVTCAEVDLSAGCHRPVTVEYVGRKETFSLKRHTVSPVWNDPTSWESVSVIISCKCRQCEHCLRKRRIHWYHRARFEMSVAPRTWFGTLTFAPEFLFKAHIRAERTARASGCDWATLDDASQFKAVLAVVGEEVTLALKRLRKQCATGAFRYLLVSEQHKSGEPHFHVLLHERSADAPITHAKLKACWTAGFSHFKLADPKAAGYVAKYISKDAAARVRASGGYGDSSAFSVSLPIRGRTAGRIAGVGNSSLGKETPGLTE